MKRRILTTAQADLIAPYRLNELVLLELFLSTLIAIPLALWDCFG